MFPWPDRLRRRRRLDDGHGDLHVGNGLHALEDVFGKARLARRDLQLGRAGDPIDRALEREEHRLVGGVHRDEHRHAEHDADHRQQRAHRVLSQVRPADESQSSA